MILKKEIFKGNRNVGKRKVADVKFYDYATELYGILKENDLIKAMERTPLLGNIPVKRRDSYTRFDYIMFQLYLYQFVEKHLNSELLHSLNNGYRCKEFGHMVIDVRDCEFTNKMLTLADIMQMLVFIYNIGHFKNTFTSSRAALDILKNNNEIRKGFLAAFKYEEHRKTATEIIKTNNYYRFHILNSLLLLQNLGLENLVIKVSINILTEYLAPFSQQSSKIQYAFKFFRSIREVSYTIYDSSLAPIPIYFDLHNDRHLKILLKEKLLGYNSKDRKADLFMGINKLLQDYLYNEENIGIAQFHIARKITNTVLKSDFLVDSMTNKYCDLIRAENSKFDIFNRKHYRKNDFDSNNLLKLSFAKEEQELLEGLVLKLNRINFVKAAWHYRLDEDRIGVLVSVKKCCEDKTKAALKATRCILRPLDILQKKDGKNGNEDYHAQSLLTAKFLLYYLLGCHRIKIEGKLNPDVCVILDRGSSRRIKRLEALIKSAKNASEDDIHEIEVLRDILTQERRNELCLIICSNILLVSDNTRVKTLAEFDGLVIFPNRHENQIVFVESKNIKRRPSISKNCLIKKFESIGVKFSEENISTFNKDSKYYYTI